MNFKCAKQTHFYNVYVKTEAFNFIPPKNVLKGIN